VNVFLTCDQLEALTGYKKPKLQRDWLATNGYHFDVRGDGRPAVLTSQVEARQQVRERVASTVAASRKRHE
jgi:hypothetical protein